MLAQFTYISNWNLSFILLGIVSEERNIQSRTLN